MIIDNVSNFREHKTLWLQNSFSLLKKLRVQITQCIIMCFPAFNIRTKIRIKSFNAFVTTLRSYMWRIIHDTSKLS